SQGPEERQGERKLLRRIKGQETRHDDAGDDRPGLRPAGDHGEDPEDAEDDGPVAPERLHRERPEAPGDESRGREKLPGLRGEGPGVSAGHGSQTFSPMARIDSAKRESRRSWALTSGMRRSKPPTSVAPIAFFPSTFPLIHQPTAP